MKSMVPVLSLFLFLILIRFTWLNSCSTSALQCRSVKSPSTCPLSFGYFAYPMSYPSFTPLLSSTNLCHLGLHQADSNPLQTKMFSFHLLSLSSSDSCCRNLIASSSSGPWISLLLHKFRTKSEKIQHRMDQSEASFSLVALVP